MDNPTLTSGNGNAAAADRAAGGVGLIGETTTQTFVRDVLEESRRQPVLVDFWAPWCGPCRQLTPILERVVREARGAVRLMKMNIDEHPAVAGQLGIQSIPAVIAFVDGRAADGFVGALPESQVKAFVERLAGAGPSAGPEVEAKLAEADAFLESGAFDKAGPLYLEVLKATGDNIRAIAGLARTAIAAGDLDGARAVLSRVPEAHASDPAIAAVRAQLALADQTAGLGDEATLRQRVAADPQDLQARFDLALVLNSRGDREGAANLLLEIVAKNRTWEEEKARRQLLRFFEAWGPTDEATLGARRRLSSLLFA
jgi:putative thioredoxin